MPLDPRDEAMLAEWLLDWEEHYERGEDVPPEALCEGREDLVDELRRRIGRLKEFDASPKADISPEPKARMSASCVAQFFELRLHAEGGLGEVYEARNAELRRQVALKFLKPKHAGHVESRDRFRNEAEITGRLEHPGIVPIYGMGEDDASQPCYAMRFIRGLPMNEAIQTLHAADDLAITPAKREALLAGLLERIQGARRGPATTFDLRERAFRELLLRFKSVCETIAYANSKGVLHRDIKPSNVMLGKFGETLVVDWGLAKTFEISVSNDGDNSDAEALETLPLDPTPSSFTPTIGPKGTPAYMSPEQASARRNLRPASDVYSLGATLYSLLSGVPPFRGRALDVVEQVQDGKFPAPRSIKPGVPRALEAICLKAMARDPENRYPSADELAADLDNWLADRPVTAWREPAAVRAGRWLKRHRTSVTTVAASLLIAGSMAGAGWSWHRARERSRLEAASRAADAALDEANRLAGQARSTGIEAHWSEALAAADRARSMLEGGGVGRAALARVEATTTILRRGRDDAHAEAEAVLRDRLLIEELEKPRLAAFDTLNGGFDKARCRAAYATSLRNYGLDVDNLSIQEATKRIVDSNVRQAICMALDDWASMVSDPQATRLREISNRADRNQTRSAIQEAVERRDKLALVGLAQLPDSFALPTGYIVMLAEALDNLGEKDEAIKILRLSLTMRPGDFRLAMTLLCRLWGDSNSEMEQFRLTTVAFALRPENPLTRAMHGLLLDKTNRRDEALAVLRRHDDSFRDSALVRLALGNVMAKTGECEAALGILRPVVDMIASDPRAREENNRSTLMTAHDEIGSVLARLGRHAEAEVEYRKALKVDPKSSATHAFLGNCLRDLGRRAEAEAEYREALQLNPGHSDAHNSLANCLRDAGQRGEAEAEYRKALEIDPNLANAHNGLGNCLRDAGQRAEAEAEYRRALVIDPKSGSAHTNLGNCLRDAGQRGEAEAEYRKALEIDPNLANAHNGLGNCLRDAGQRAEAEAEYRRALVIDPKSGSAHTNLGNCLRDAGQRGEAEAEYRKALEIDPNLANAHNGLGNCLRDAGQRAEAEAEYRRTLQLNPRYSDAHNGLGNCLRDTNRTTEAEAVYRRAIELDPSNGLAYDNLGLMLTRLNRRQDALVVFRRALAINPKNARAHFQIGSLLFDQGDPEAALAEANRSLEIDPEMAEAHFLIGIALSNRGAMADSLAAFRRGRELGSRRADWPQSSANVIREAELLAVLEARLPAVLDGKDSPSPEERCQIATLCVRKRRNNDAARLFAEAFAASPSLAEALGSGHRYNAGCAAALASAGKGDPPAPEETRDALRSRALAWLRDDLAAWARLVDARSTEAGRAKAVLLHWKDDLDLVSLREEHILSPLSDVDRAACRSLWTDVDALLKRVGETDKK